MDDMSFYDDEDLKLGSVELKMASGGRVIKGDDCQYIKLNSLINNTDCMSGQSEETQSRESFLVYHSGVKFVKGHQGHGL